MPLRTIVLLAALSWTAFATAATAVPAAAQNAAVDCTLIGLEQLSALAGTAVSPPDEAAAGSGMCFFPSSSAADDAVVSYAVVRPQTLAQRTAYFKVQSRLCAGIDPAAPRAALCALYAKLAAVTSVDGYFEARTQSDPAAQPVPDLGDRAAATADGLYVQRANLMLEIAVRREGALDADAETKLARTLLERIPAAQTP